MPTIDKRMIIRKLDFFSKINNELIKNNLNFFRGFDLFNSKKPKFSKKDISELWSGHLKERSKAGIKDPLSLYVHIPFCAQRCNFCCYHSDEYSKERINRYLESIKNDCEYFKKTFSNIEFNSVYFGGGTPNILNHKQLNRLLSSIFNNFRVAKRADITTEGIPAFITKRKVALLNRYGINRFSFGVQSLNKKVLDQSARLYQTERQIKNAISFCQKSGVKNINIDLIFGLKSDNDKSFLKSFNKALSFSAATVTVYKLRVPKDYYKLFYTKRIENPRDLFKKNYNLSNIFQKMAKAAQKNNYIFNKEDLGLNYGNQCIVFNRSDFIDEYAHKATYSFFSKNIESCFGLGLYSQSHTYGKAFYRDANHAFILDEESKIYTGNTITMNREVLYEMVENLIEFRYVDTEKINAKFDIDFFKYFTEPIKELTILKAIKIKKNKLYILDKKIKKTEAILFFVRSEFLRTLLSVQAFLRKDYFYNLVEEKLSI
ncbi:MAG: hypothetical protein A2042_04020 [Candidatus Schekmanbacteria bacterium GWA2_38_11]|uniref:Radical SAM core domain-containing protein n=1 Tax=Candidatus Schekmanbacteria bacterium GWA2_38_11 TaxID=1817876 RepID=A0A1F7RPK9_9BACT|nr:MAG: hypothetical protein A2042_04020 [Candidatus Schekmanbacteria bacterium GWA2_38_11]